MEGTAAEEVSAGGEEGIINNSDNTTGDLQGVPVVDVDEASVVDTSEDEEENSHDDDETIDDGITVPLMT